MVEVVTFSVKLLYYYKKLLDQFTLGFRNKIQIVLKSVTYNLDPQ